MPSLEQKIGQMMYIGFDGLEPPDYVLDWLASGRIGGVYLFARNVASPQQLADLIQACHDAASSPILVGIDQEGGLVARLREGFTESPGMMALAASGDPTIAEHMAEVLAAEMYALGINWVFAPVVDIVHDINNPSVSTRAAGMTAEQVVEYTLPQVRGFQKYVAATAKHFPGLGKSPVDTHLELATLDDSLEYIRANDLIPFHAAVEANVATIMTTHTKFTALDATHPATLSPVVINTLLRDELQFNGVVATDCLEMQAITDHYGAGESAVLAVLAGVDTIMFSHTRARQEEAYQAVLAAVQSGRIPEDTIDSAYKRITTLKAAYPANRTPDLSLIRSPKHLKIARLAARAGTTLIRDHSALLPLPQDEKIGLIEFASYLDSEVIEETGRTGFANLLSAARPNIKHVALRADEHGNFAVDTALQLVAESNVIVLATRSTHLISKHQALVEQLKPHFKKLILVCLRNPYDVDLLPSADVMLCTHGDAAPSMQAAVDVLVGEHIPTGKLPVRVNVMNS